MLSPEQFQQRADILNQGDGFSVRTVGVHAGEEARGSVLVGGAAAEGRVPVPVKGEHIAAYAESNAKALRPAHRYLGGWGRTLDVSDAFPSGAKGTTMAVIAGITRGEDSVGEVDADGQFARELPTTAGMANPATTGYRSPLNRVRRQHRLPS